MSTRSTSESSTPDEQIAAQQREIGALRRRARARDQERSDLERIVSAMQRTMGLVRGDNGPPLVGDERAEAMEIVDELTAMATNLIAGPGDTSSGSESSVDSEDEESDTDSEAETDFDDYRGGWQAFMTDEEWNRLSPDEQERRSERFDATLDNWYLDSEESDDEEVDPEQIYPGTDADILAAVPARSYLSRAEFRAWLGNELDEEERRELLRRILP